MQIPKILFQSEEGFIVTNSHETNGAPTLEREVELEVDRLSSLVRRLRAECENLRKSSAKAELDRDLYLRALYEKMRKDLVREFENVTLEELQATSAGPVEIID